ncbi:hypothetical protein BH20ACT5_BH20ACT5_09410 [soil metagenome]
MDTIRRQVLATWIASPARFREDANAEEDLVLGGYRDRLLVELAQNAADAAVEAGVPGHLRLTLDGEVLRAANTGTPVDAAGVQALATLRASAKRDSATIGRYGVGFAAVLAVSDTPRIVSHTGAVRFSAPDTRAAVAEVPALAEELERRDGAVPVLRLPFPAEGAPPSGFDTEVVLPLRAGVRELVVRLLAGLGADVLLGLRGLAVLEVDGRILRRSDDGRDVVLHDGPIATRWRVESVTGELAPELLRDRPVEERQRATWSVTWAVPVSMGDPVPLPGRQVVHAPTPSDEPLSLPVRLIASYPLGPDRRHVAPGPVTAEITARAAAAYAELVRGLGTGAEVLELVPRLALAGAELDAALCAAVLTSLGSADWLPQAASSSRVPPSRAHALDPVSDELVDTLGEVIPGLLPADWSARRHAPVLAALGVPRLGPAQLVEQLSGVHRPPAWWRGLYAALAGLGTLDDRDALAALPVPLADGRMAYGVRGLLLPAPELPTADLAGLGLRLVDAAAAHPLLERLGAQPATTAGILADPDVRSAVEASLDEEDPEPITAAVLALVRATGVRPGELSWLADLALPDAGGGWSAAGELILPGSGLADVLAPGTLGVLAPAVVARWGVDALTAVGVLAGFAVLRAEDLEIGDDLDLDGLEDWYDAVADRLPVTTVPPRIPLLLAVRDLELVRPGRWTEALGLLERLPAEIFAPIVLTLDGQRVSVPAYSRWWLSTHQVLAGQRPDRLRAPGFVELRGLYDEAPADLPSLVACLSTVDDVLADPESALDLLDRLGDPRRSVVVPADLYARLAAALDGVAVRPPERVRDVTGHVVDSATAVVLDAPYALPLLDRPVVAGGGEPSAVAALLDLPLASEAVTAGVTSTAAEVVAWQAVPGAGLAARRLGVAELPGQVAIHRPLLVGSVAVSWWPGEGVDYVDGSAAGLGRALAWRHGSWQLRAALTEAFADPDGADRLAAEDAAG